MPRTPKQVLAEQKKQAERNRARQPAQSIVVIKPALPASLDHRSPHERYLDDCAPSGVVGRLIKFTKEGKFCFHDDGEAIAESEDFVVLADQTLVSWVKFNGEGEPPTRHGGLLYSKGFVMPPREGLGDTDERGWPVGLSGRPEDPWKHEQMIVLRRPTTLELFTFSTSSKTGRRAVGNLLRHFDRLRWTTPGALPVVRLKPSGYNDSRFGWVHTPLFVVVGMADGHSAAAPDTSLETQMNDRVPF